MDLLRGVFDISAAEIKALKLFLGTKRSFAIQILNERFGHQNNCLKAFFFPSKKSDGIFLVKYAVIDIAHFISR